MGCVFKFRLLPFLHPDVIMRGGKPESTAEFADFMARNFFVFGGLVLSASLLWMAARGAKK